MDKHHSIQCAAAFLFFNNWDMCAVFTFNGAFSWPVEKSMKCTRKVICHA